MNADAHGGASRSDVERSEVAAPRTARLVGAPPGEGDLGFLCALLGDRRVGETLGGVRGEEEVAEILAAHRAHWAREGFGYWIWRDRASGEPIARGGLSRASVQGEPVVEVGWAVRPDPGGEGLATELGACSLQVAARLGIPQVVAYALPHNVASRRVMEKLGMRYDREFIHGWGSHALYRTEVPGHPG